MSREERLFNRVDWHRQIEAQRQGLSVAVQKLTKAQFSAKSIDELADELAQQCRLDIPVLNEADITVSQREVDVQLGGRDDMWGDRSHRTVKGVAITVRVPFTGDPDMFGVQPSTYSNPPLGEVRRGEVVFEIRGTDFAREPPKPRIDQNIENIKKYLQWQRDGLGDFNETIKTRAVAEIQQRKAKLEKDDDVLSGLGYKVVKP
jgi:hypothetical protein